MELDQYTKLWPLHRHPESLLCDRAVWEMERSHGWGPDATQNGSHDRGQPHSAISSSRAWNGLLWNVGVSSEPNPAPVSALPGEKMEHLPRHHQVRLHASP